MTQRINVSNKCGVFPDSLKRKPLAACLVAALGLVSVCKHASAATITVNSCADDNNLSLNVVELRKAVAQASSGDTIDMTGLTCSTITLQKGEIPISVGSLTFYGPTVHPLTIDAGSQSRVFDHSGSGQLTVDHLTLTNGKAPTASNYGACVASVGPVLLTNDSLTNCQATTGAALYSGGNAYVSHGTFGNDGNAIYAHGTLTVRYSTISGGGIGAIAQGTLQVVYSVVTGNSLGVYAPPSTALNVLYSTLSHNRGCGVFGFNGPITVKSSTIDYNGCGIATAESAVTLFSSTISHNSYAGNGAGGVMVNTGVGLPVSTLTITNSTIANNYGKEAGGIKVYNTRISLSNSTIAFNSGGLSGGIYAHVCSLGLQSTIIAANVISGGNPDYSDAQLVQCGSPNGSNNLIGIQSFPLAGTINGDAGLTPLGDHGGRVPTVALLASSRAVDAGNNAANLVTDTRGGAFLRVVGAAADIGAYERQPKDDEIFYSGFQ